MTSKVLSPWMLDRRGNHVPMIRPEPSDIDFYSMAHHLAQQNRYNGAAKFPYSVAQHSCLVHDRLDEPYKLYGLLHDGHEYIPGDFTTPQKRAMAAMPPAAW